MVTTEGVSLISPFYFPPSLLFNVYLSYLFPKQVLRLKLCKHLKQKQLPYQSTAYSVIFSCNFSAFPLNRARLWWTAQNSSSLVPWQHGLTEKVRGCGTIPAAAAAGRVCSWRCAAPRSPSGAGPRGTAAWCAARCPCSS